MNQLTLKLKSYRVKLLIEIKYIIYKLKKVFGLKTIGYNQYNGLVIFKFLQKYKLPLYSMHVVRTEQDLNTIDLEEIHDYGLQLEKEDYLSFIVNTVEGEVKIVIGENLNKFVNDFKKSEIEDLMQTRFNKDEIIAGMEEGIKQVYLAFQINNKN